ncbi:MAG TPA: C4-type zinc ribbon domain-containing protein [bacterium]|nr:C4-type zinc ribbon domain-containing protein [bacterium]
MHPADILEKLIQVQHTDSGRDELERLKKDQLAQIAALDKKVAELKARIAAEKKVLEDQAKARKTLEIEVGTLETKIKKYQGQEGEVKSNEQMLALQHETAKAKEDRSKAEEKALEGLFREDTLKAGIQGLQEQLDRDEQRAEQEKKEIRSKIGELDKALAEKLSERSAQLMELPEDFREGYEKLRNTNKKIAVAKVSDDRICEGCHMNVPPQLLNEVKKGIAIHRCDCGRYLYL